jgi:hypothetical protein
MGVLFCCRGRVGMGERARVLATGEGRAQLKGPCVGYWKGQSTAKGLCVVTRSLEGAVIMLLKLLSCGL